jgi:hypothetical protein
VDQGAEGRQTLVLWCYGRDVLVLSCSSGLLSAVHAKREGSAATGGRRDEGKVRTWGGVKADEAGYTGVQTPTSIRTSGR